MWGSCVSQWGSDLACEGVLGGHWGSLIQDTSAERSLPPSNWSFKLSLRRTGFMSWSVGPLFPSWTQTGTFPLFILCSVQAALWWTPRETERTELLVNHSINSWQPEQSESGYPWSSKLLTIIVASKRDLYIILSVKLCWHDLFVCLIHFSCIQIGLP